MVYEQFQSNLKLNVIESETDSDIYRVKEEYPMHQAARKPIGSILSSLDSDNWCLCAELPGHVTARETETCLVLFLRNVSFFLFTKRNRDSRYCGS